MPRKKAPEPVNENNVKTYKKGVPVKLVFKQILKEETSHFLSTEFDCHCKRPDCQETLIDETLIMKLEWIRRSYGVVKINCGFRCRAHNAEVKGSSTNSQHCLGMAADIVLSKYKPHQIQVILTDKFVNEQVGLSVGRYDTFTHVDTRPFPVIYDKRTEEGRLKLDEEYKEKLLKLKASKKD